EVAAELDQRARLRRGDRSCREQVARAESRAVRREMGEELRPRPVQRARVAVSQRTPIECQLEVDAERPVASDAEVAVRLGVLRLRLDADGLEQRERCHPRRDRRGERLAEERAERLVLPRLDVARAPVVDDDDAADGAAEPRLRSADDETELDLHVELLRRPERAGAELAGG